MANRRAGLVALLGLPLMPISTAQQAPEAAVKAAYLINFLNYVEWPLPHLQHATDPLVVGIAGAEEVLDALRSITADRTVRTHPVQVRRVRADDVPATLHLLYVGAPMASTRPLLLRLQGQAVLLVADGPQGLDAGAMLSFVVVNGRIRFEAAPLTAERAGLKLSARLLAVAERVSAR